MKKPNRTKGKLEIYLIEIGSIERTTYFYFLTKGGRLVSWYDKLIRKSAKSASEAISDTVKKELKVATNSMLPILGVIGLGVLGWQIFRRSNTDNSITGQPTVTYNFFFGEDGKEIMQELLKSKIRRIK